ncbi:hypothetical protein C0216_08785 [Streptomyces globosus]|uniref:ParB/Sulfiredoxin domain-containing protein n=1 Tax=Streptomyces globosus TaxID=68209 RepID=A0A344TY24_9ACTN|nr:DUF6551 family protein [Streptomyces globosus]AXE23545.1 hypothetical protein C0216_08785 [Streptomyces globosus]
MSVKDYSYDIPDHPIEYKKVDPRKITFDTRAQRNLNKARAQKIADNIVPTALGTPILSLREDGKLVPMDGMHRIYGCQLAIAAGVTAVEKIHCEIHTGLTLANEASMFIIKNKESSKVGATDEYRIGLVAGHPLFVDTQAVLDKHGLKVGSRSVSGVRGINGILKIVRDYGDHRLDQALAISEEAFGRTAESWDHVILSGIAVVMHRHSDVIKPKDLATRLARQGAALNVRAKIQGLSTANGTRGDGTQGRIKAAHLFVAGAWNNNRSAANRIPIPNIFE